jgi:methionine--tRNA ligase beta chain
LKVEADSVVELDVTTRLLPEGEVVESTLGRDVLLVHLGRGALAPGIERALVGMGVGEEKSLEISPEDGYGPVLPENIHRRRRHDFPAGVELKPGMRFAAKLKDGSGRAEFGVREVTGDEVVIDFNHPFAGRQLRVWVLVRSVRPPTAAEASETAALSAERLHRQDSRPASKEEGAMQPGPITSSVPRAAAPSANPSSSSNPTPGPNPSAPSSPESSPAEVSVDDVLRLGLRVAVVRAASRVKGTDRLLQLEVDLGDEQRTLVAGVAARYEPEAIVGRSIIVVANLKPATIRGIQSRGMLLAAVGADGRPILASFEEAPPPGTQVR